MTCSEEPAYFQLPVLENQFTSNDLEELLTFFQPSPINDDDTSTGDEPVSSNSGSDDPRSGTPEEMDVRKEKRKISNRESARRSRGRKKKHFENLTAQLSRLKAQNRVYKNQLSLKLYQLHAVRRQNDEFQLESVVLLQRHSHLNRVLQFQHKRISIIDNSISLRLSMEGNGPFRLQRYSY